MRMFFRFALTLLLTGYFGTYAISVNAQSFHESCWKIVSMKGYGLYKSDVYKPVTDGFSHEITIIFNGNNTKASGDATPLIQTANYMAVGTSSSAGMSEIETYLIDPELDTAIYTKTTTGRYPFQDMTGAHMFIGRAFPCK